MITDAAADTTLRHADRLMSEVVPGTRGLWPRCAAWLIRLALEQSVDSFLAERAPEAGGASYRTKFLVLRYYVDRDRAAAMHQLWAALSRACHHHAFELAPTAAELRRWHQQASSAAAWLGRESR